MRGNKGLLHNLGILTTGQIIAQLANVVVLIYLADLLGTHDFGIVQIGVAVMGYALIIAEWGLFTLGVRETSRMDTPPEIFAYARSQSGLLALQAGGALVLGLLILPRLPFYRHDPLVFLVYLAMVLPQVYSQGWVATGLERMEWVGLARIARSLVYAALVLALVAPLDGFAGQAALRWVPGAFLVATLASNLVVNIPLARWFGRFIHPGPISWRECKRRWQETAPIGASSVVLRVLFNIDLLLLGILASPSQAGLYAAAAKIMFLLVIAVEVLWVALLPRLSRLARKDPPGFRRAFNLHLGTVTALLLPLALGGYLVGEDLMGLFFGPEYLGAGAVFQVLALAYTCLALATFLGNVLLAEDRQRWYLYPLLLSSLVAVGSIWALVPGQGIMGAARGLLLAHGTLLTILIILNRRHFSRLLAQTLAGVLPALLIMGGLVWALSSQPVLLRVAAGAAVYGLGALPLLLRLRRLSSHQP